MAKQIQALARPNAAAAINFLLRVGASDWRLVADAKPKLFRATEREDVASWIERSQGSGKPVSALLPEHAGDHWWLQARLPRTASPSRLRPLPQIILGADEFTALWRLAAPVPAARAIELTQIIVGRAGRPAIGEPVPLPGTIRARQSGNGEMRRYPVHSLPAAKSRGYRVIGNALVDADAVSMPAPKADPRFATIDIAEGVQIQPGSSNNGFIVIVGGSGSGKTVAIRRCGGDLRKYGLPLLTFDFHGDVDIPGTTRTLISAGTDSVIGINPLEVLKADARLKGLHDQVVAFVNLMRRARPDLGALQVGVLETALASTFERAGILEHDPSTWDRPAPRIADLVRRLEEMVEMEAKETSKRAHSLLVTAGSLFRNPVFHRARTITTQELLTGNLHLNLSALEDSEKMVVTDTLLRRVFSALKSQQALPEAPATDRERFRLFVVIDEVQKLVKGGGERILNELFTEARKFGLGMILGTQSASNLTPDIRANASTLLALMHSRLPEAKDIAPDVGVDPQLLMDLPPHGHGYLRARPAAARRIRVRKA